jgi:hypothetical protein
MSHNAALIGLHCSVLLLQVVHWQPAQHQPAAA